MTEIERPRIAFFRATRKVELSTQKEAAKLHGYPDHYWWTLGPRADNIEDALGSLRKGCQVGVYRYDLLAEPKTKKFDRAPRKSLRHITDTLLGLGVVVHEWSTGRTCKDEQGVYRIYADAIDRLAGDKGQRAGPGRPKEHIYSDAECQLIETAFHREGLRNGEERAEAVRALKDENGNHLFPRFKLSTWYSLRNLGRVE